MVLRDRRKLRQVSTRRTIQPRTADSGWSSSTAGLATVRFIHRRRLPTPGAGSPAAWSVPEVVRMHPKDALGRPDEQLAAEYLTGAGDCTIEHLRGVG